MSTLAKKDSELKETQVRIELSFELGDTWTEVADFRNKLREIFSGSKDKWVCGFEGIVSLRMAGLSSRSDYTLWQGNGPEDLIHTHACRVIWSPNSLPKALWEGNHTACVVDLHRTMRENALSRSIHSRGRYVSHLRFHSEQVVADQCNVLLYLDSEFPAASNPG